MAKTFDFKVFYTIPRKRIDDVIMSLAACYSPWIGEVSWERTTKDHFELVVQYDKADKGTFKGQKVVKKKDIELGLVALARHAPERLGNIQQEDYDAIDADVFFQCVVFGKIIYG